MERIQKGTHWDMLTTDEYLNLTGWSIGGGPLDHLYVSRDNLRWRLGRYRVVTGLWNTPKLWIYQSA